MSKTADTAELNTIIKVEPTMSEKTHEAVTAGLNTVPEVEPIISKKVHTAEPKIGPKAEPIISEKEHTAARNMSLQLIWGSQLAHALKSSLLLYTLQPAPIRNRWSGEYEEGRLSGELWGIDAWLAFSILFRSRHF
jgi:hypothetical protein